LEGIYCGSYFLLGRFNVFSHYFKHSTVFSWNRTCDLIP
jgi:hypothetical protein